jgi:hypothetical protein
VEKWHRKTTHTPEKDANSGGSLVSCPALRPRRAAEGKNRGRPRDKASILGLSRVVLGACVSVGPIRRLRRGLWEVACRACRQTARGERKCVTPLIRTLMLFDVSAGKAPDPSYGAILTSEKVTHFRRRRQARNTGARAEEKRAGTEPQEPRAHRVSHRGEAIKPSPTTTTSHKP